MTYKLFKTLTLGLATTSLLSQAANSHSMRSAKQPAHDQEARVMTELGGSEAEPEVIEFDEKTLTNYPSSFKVVEDQYLSYIDKSDKIQLARITSSENGSEPLQVAIKIQAMIKKAREKAYKGAKFKGKITASVDGVLEKFELSEVKDTSEDIKFVK